MRLNKIFLTATLLLAGVCANAQETVTEYVFQPHWFGQLQIGGQETLGEGKFGKLLSGNAQIAAGYKFNPYIGMRLAVNAWASRGAVKFDNLGSFNYNNGNNNYYKWNYIAPTLDAVVDMTNLIGGYNPTRLVEVDFLAGLGVNYAWHNKDAQRISASANAAYNSWFNSTYPQFDHNTGADKTVDFKNGLGFDAWEHGKWRFLGQFGCAVNFNVSSRVQIGLELMANITNDCYNSKHWDNTDWYFNALLGVGYSFGPKYSVNTRVIEPEPEPVVVEKIVEKIVEVPVQVEEKKVEKEVFRRDVFFLINQHYIRPQEMEKVAQVAEYLQTHPNATVTITGYADKGTGTQAFNLRLSAQRSQAVAKALQDRYYIPASRMIVKSMGEDMYQPYPDAVQNRVAICIAE
ncbi:MAG: OmpA family protein [Muribaculaceae bacterium]|nr:OmpA family protein [Muribaculaceae bacterium]